MYTSIFNRLRAIASYWSEIVTFSYPPLAFNAPVRSGPWDNRGKCYMNRKIIQCLLNALQHVSINLQPFLRYSKLLVENCDILIPFLCLAAPRGWLRRNFAKILVYTKLEWMGYRVMKKLWQYVQPFWYSTSVWQTDGRTDGRTFSLLSIMCFSIADARKNEKKN